MDLLGPSFWTGRYLNQSRTILFNLKDAKNQTFASKLLEGDGFFSNAAEGQGPGDLGGGAT